MDQFKSTDGLIQHLGTVVPRLANPGLEAQYIGFFTVSVVTVLELCIKDLLISFAAKKNKHFGIYCANVFERLNGRVTLKDLKEAHIKRFGQKYVTKFEARVDSAELQSLRDRGISIKASYGNVIVWRNSFAHTGVLPVNASFDEARKGYEAGKEVISCLAQAMVR